MLQIGILFPPGGICHTTPIAQQVVIPVLAPTDPTILRLESTDGALQFIVRAGEAHATHNIGRGASVGWRASAGSGRGMPAPVWKGGLLGSGLRVLAATHPAFAL